MVIVKEERIEQNLMKYIKSLYRRTKDYNVWNNEMELDKDVLSSFCLMVEEAVKDAKKEMEETEI